MFEHGEAIMAAATTYRRGLGLTRQVCALARHDVHSHQKKRYHTFHILLVFFFFFSFTKYILSPSCPHIIITRGLD